MVVRKRSSKATDDWRSEDLEAVDEAIDHIVAPLPAAKRTARVTPALRRILVAVDGTSGSDDALAWTRELATRFGAEVWVTTVLPPKSFYATMARRAGWTGATQDMMKKDERNGELILEQALAPLKSARLVAEGVLARGFPVHEIERVAKARRIDLIVVGSHGHAGAERILLGSVADGIKNEVTTNVLIAKGRPGKGPVLAPIDGSKPSRAAAFLGIRLARTWGAEALVLHVFDLPWLGWETDGPLEFQEIIKKFKLPASPKGVRYLLDYGRAAQQVLKAVTEQSPRLVVMGSRGMSGLKSLVAGAVSNRVAHESPVSVLLVKTVP